jgi:hypothetical protein
VLFAVTHAALVLGAAALCFAAAALAELRLPPTADVAVRPEVDEHALRSIAHGWQAVRSEAQLSLVTALFAAKNLGRGALNVLIVLVPLELLDLGSAGVGWLTAVAGTGGVLGGIAAAALVGRRTMIPGMARSASTAVGRIRTDRAQGLRPRFGSNLTRSKDGSDPRRDEQRNTGDDQRGPRPHELREGGGRRRADRDRERSHRLVRA